MGTTRHSRSRRILLVLSDGFMAGRFYQRGSWPKKTGAETAPEDVPKEEDESKERCAPRFHPFA
jgi:hypothetical protein